MIVLDKIETCENKVEIWEAQDNEVETLEECVNGVERWEVTDITNNIDLDECERNQDSNNYTDTSRIQ